ncbi:MAG: metallophosphoesterase [Verrucomicrobiae bacterium]|nr:metallophosphoesterase [Verrucomicrobiae bacterium]
MKDPTRLYNRRNFLRLGFYGSGAGMFGYGSLIERRTPRIERVTCPLPARHAGLDGLKIAVMSDFHHDEFHDDTLIGGAVETMNSLKPDVVFFPGDFISRDVSGMDALVGHFQKIEARVGAFACLGNHDQWNAPKGVAKRLEQGGVSVLKNAATELRAPRTGERFVLAGLESAWSGDPDLAKTLRGMNGDVPVLLGWHEPDPFDTITDGRVLLQMAGHTHGGQVCAPFYGAIRLPQYGRKYVAGLYGDERARLYVTRGIGSMGVPVRFCCPPEISLVTLRAKTGDEDANRA